MNDHPDSIELLQARLNALEKRVQHLEASSACASVSESQPISPSIVPSREPVDRNAAPQAPGLILAAGKSMLGIAGAYMLRALADVSATWRPAVAAVAVLYAIAWMMLAVRSRGDSRLPRLLFCATSALILAPMLWELTLRFHLLSPAVVALVLGLYAGIATALTLRQECPPVFPVACIAAALTAVALSIVTRSSLVFICLLLLMWIAAEARTLHRPAGSALSNFLAFAIDVALWLLIFVYRMPASARADYPPLGPVELISPSLIFFCLIVARFTVRHVGQRAAISAFDAVQAMAGFLLMFASLGYFLPGFFPRIAGSVCIAMAALCYATAWIRFRPAGLLRNFAIVAVWSALLLLAGVALSLPAPWQPPVFMVATLAAARIADRIRCIALECHAAVYLLMAAALSGFVTSAYAALAGRLPPGLSWPFLAFVACALVCYLFIRRNRTRQGWLQYVLEFLPALAASLAVSALITVSATVMIARMEPLAAFLLPPGIAVMRTLAFCLVALALAYAGGRARRTELTHIAYLVLAMVAIKLLLEDLPLGRLTWIAGSISLFAMTLIAIPRVGRALKTT